MPMPHHRLHATADPIGLLACLALVITRAMPRR